MAARGYMCVLIAAGIVLTVSAGCPSSSTTEWCEAVGKRLTNVATFPLANSNMGLTGCKAACLGRVSCVAINFIENGCEMLEQSDDTNGGVFTNSSEYTFSYYVCAPETCSQQQQQDPVTSAEPENEPEPEGEAEVTPEEFWRWLRDEPQWFALIGMGVVVILMLIIIIVLICRLKQQSK